MSADKDAFDEAVKELQGIENNAMASELYEAYEGWKAAGFSDPQAIYLCASALTGNPGKPPLT